MASHLIVHAGLHKAGSTLLQKSLFPNISSSLYIGKYRSKSISQLLQEHGTQNIIWSDEALLGRLIDIYSESRDETWADVNIRNMRDLKKLHPDLKLILCFRHPKTWLPSIYGHYLKYGGQLTSEVFFKEIIHVDDLLIFPRVEAARELFGNNFLGFYLEDLINGECVSINSFFQEVDDIPFAKNRLYNSGLQDPEKSVLRSINKFPFIRNINHPDRKDIIAVILRKAGMTPFDIAKNTSFLIKLLHLSPSKETHNLPDYVCSLERDYEKTKKFLSIDPHQ